ncbi:zinc ABC transporter substrate-binding protein [Acidithrix sp. C25]|uniref:metal ABC transporter solute-binding protein, Zn/Mn family n=1 Tax=Acidithrix sp. C25 TaxID=1671482 RepID=UPI00191B9256|nr:zinc ABC transporter substrate-binding protein [Acidithrix sp. C25]
MVKTFRLQLIRAIVIMLAVLMVASCGTTSTSALTQSKGNYITAVAAEDTWGSLLSQLGGRYLHVLSVITDPNADPHAYEVSNSVARAFSSASIVVINGAGYDDWAAKVLGATPSKTRQELNVAAVLKQGVGANPHFWYSPTYVRRIVAVMEGDLIKAMPTHRAYFEANFRLVSKRLDVLYQSLANLSRRYHSMAVASTEDIFVYFARASGLNLISPLSFMAAIANGNDPPISSVVTFEEQLRSHSARLLIYNTQTITPLTSSIRAMAIRKGIGVVGISEIIEPVGATFEAWMGSQIDRISSALGRSITTKNQGQKG